MTLVSYLFLFIIIIFYYYSFLAKYECIAIAKGMKRDFFVNVSHSAKMKLTNYD